VCLKVVGSLAHKFFLVISFLAVGREGVFSSLSYPEKTLVEKVFDLKSSREAVSDGYFCFKIGFPFGPLLAFSKWFFLPAVFFSPPVLMVDFGLHRFQPLFVFCCICPPA